MRLEVESIIPMFRSMFLTKERDGFFNLSYIVAKVASMTFTQISEQVPQMQARDSIAVKVLPVDPPAPTGNKLQLKKRHVLLQILTLVPI